MTRWVDIIVIVLVALGALAVSAVIALYFIDPTRIKIAGGEAREYFLTFNAPPGTVVCRTDRPRSEKHEDRSSMTLRN